ncbi:uncharacterized protein LOC121744194 [Salvia splendens]|uniref:uncharacterized protein LOC121744194 n=1 Tax=Salvia splendens TaxID=180675 RepID=UPI001C26BC86|nr:uncharacterized protein LOC121744194 [Salvia splendens]
MLCIGMRIEVKRRKRHKRKHVENQEPCIMRGVYFKNLKWQAAIKVDKKQIHLGTVGSQEEATRLYDRTCHCEPLKAQALRIVLCSFLAPISPIFEQGQDPQNSENTKLVSVHPLPLNDSLKPKESPVPMNSLVQTIQIECERR